MCPFVLLKQGGTLGSFSSDICRLLQLCDEEDDATSKLAAPKPEPADQNLEAGKAAVFQRVSCSLQPIFYGALVVCGVHYCVEVLRFW